MRKTDVIAVLCSDIHLSHKPPSARSGEQDWYAAMQRQVYQLHTLAADHDVPVICAGDVFDRWNSPPELINWAASHLPVMWSIPGQHDLPWHGYDQLQKSAYWTLVELGVLKDIRPGEPEHDKGLVLYGFPWGFDLEPIEPQDELISIAVIHKYCWSGNHGYEGAPKDSQATAWGPLLRGYNVAVVGDNHSGFTTQAGGCTIFNAGGFMRRRVSEREYRPSVGLLHADGSIKRKYLDTSEDILTDAVTRLEAKHDESKLREFVEDMLDLEADQIDFIESLERVAETVGCGARSVLQEVIENVRTR